MCSLILLKIIWYNKGQRRRHLFLSIYIWSLRLTLYALLIFVFKTDFSRLPRIEHGWQIYLVFVLDLLVWLLWWCGLNECWESLILWTDVVEWLIFANSLNFGLAVLKAHFKILWLVVVNWLICWLYTLRTVIRNQFRLLHRNLCVLNNLTLSFLIFLLFNILIRSFVIQLL